MELNKKTLFNIGLLLCGAILFYLTLHHLSDILHWIGVGLDIVFPLILGACIAFILNIPMRGFERLFDRITPPNTAKKQGQGRRILAIILTLLSVIGIVALALGIVVPQIGTTFGDLPTTFLSFWDSIVAWAERTPWIAKNVLPRMDLQNIDWAKVWDSISSYVFDGAGTLLSASIGFASTVVTAVVDFVIAVVFAIYILMRKEVLGVQAKKILYAFCKKQTAERLITFGDMTARIFSNFVTGQCLEACLLGLMFFVCMILTGLPYAMAISVLIGVTAVIPICGAFIGCAVGLFLIVMVSPMQALWFLILFFALQQLEENFVYPKVVGSSVGLPAIWVLAAITVGGSLMGIVGMLVFVPFFSVLYVLLRMTVDKRLKSKRLRITPEGMLIELPKEETEPLQAQPEAAVLIAEGKQEKKRKTQYGNRNTGV